MIRMPTAVRARAAPCCVLDGEASEVPSVKREYRRRNLQSGSGVETNKSCFSKKSGVAGGAKAEAFCSDFDAFLSRVLTWKFTVS